MTDAVHGGLGFGQTGSGHDEANEQTHEPENDNFVPERNGIHHTVTDHLTAELQAAQRGDAVVLRLEQVGRTEARVLQYVVWFIMAILVILSIVTMALSRSSNSVAYPSRVWMLVPIILESVFLGGVLFVSSILLWRVYDAKRKHKYWSPRRQFLILDAGIVLTCVTVSLALGVVSYAVAISTCAFSSKAAAVYQFFRISALITLLTWMLCALRAMRIWKPPTQSKLKRLFCASCVKATTEQGPVDPEAPADPDRLLVVDRPIKDQLQTDFYLLILWLALEILLLVILIIKLVDQRNRPLPPLRPECQTVSYEQAPISCTPNTATAVAFTAFSLLLLVFFILHWREVNATSKAQDELPLSHYRLSHTFVRLQQRYGRVLFFCIFITGVFFPALEFGSCRGLVDWQLGNLPVNLVLGVYAISIGILMLPARAGDTFTQAVYQLFAWTDDQKDAKVALRNALLEEHKAKVPAWEAQTAAAVDQVTNWVMINPKLQETEKETESSRSNSMESLFSMETAVKLLHWSRLAYRELDVVAEDTGIFNRRHALSLFNLSHIEQLHEPTCDTWAVLGSGVERITDVSGSAQHCCRPTIVLSFRGTVSSANIFTDLRAWSVAYKGETVTVSLPDFLSSAAKKHVKSGDKDEQQQGDQQRKHGRATNAKVRTWPLRVHAGFFRAWTAGGFESQVVNAVKQAIKQPIKQKEGAISEMELSDDAPPRIYVTGHSLGGALACLAAVELAKQIPEAEITCYTFGAPRVGNRAFAKYAEFKVPDTWAVVRLEDPVPRIPKGTYKRTGQRVVLLRKGDLVVLPSYFEVSLLGKAGGKVSDHATRGYCAALAMAAKAQFIRSRCLPGGMEGALALGKAVDLESTLLVRPLRGEALQDGGLHVEAIEEPDEDGGAASKRTNTQHGGVASVIFCGVCGGRDDGISTDENGEHHHHHGEEEKEEEEEEHRDRTAPPNVNEETDAGPMV